MKKSILILAIALIGQLTFGQAKNGKAADTVTKHRITKVIKPLLAVKDTAKADPNLRIDISKEIAAKMVPGLQAAYSGVTRAKNISAEDADDARRVSSYFLDLIYKKWPDLIPTQPANQ